MSRNNTVEAIHTKYFSGVIDQVDQAFAKHAKKTAEVGRIRDEFVKKIKEIQEFNLSEYKKNSSYTSSRIKQLNKAGLKEDELIVRRNRENYKLNCWFISATNFKHESTKLKYPLGVLVINNVHVHNKVLAKFRLILNFFFLF